MADLQNDTSKKLAVYIDRLERLNAEKEGIGKDINDVLKEVGNDGFDKNIVKMILKRRKLGAGQCAVIDDLVVTYEAAIIRQGELMLGGKEPIIPIGRGKMESVRERAAKLIADGVTMQVSANPSPLAQVAAKTFEDMGGTVDRKPN